MRSLSHRARIGSSLLEVLIACSVLTIACLGAFSSMLSARKLQDHSVERDIARGVLAAAMDATLQRSVDDLIGGDPKYSEGAVLALDAYYLPDQELVFRTPDYTEGAAAPAVLTVELELTWTSESGGVSKSRLTSCKRGATP